MNKCFCHITIDNESYEVKDAKAREEIENIKRGIDNINFSNYDIVVAKDGTGDYTSLMDAVTNAIDGQIILVKKGTYDNEVVNAIGKKLTIIGEEKETTIIQNSYDDYERQPLTICKGEVKNLTIKQIGSESLTNIKSYAVHIDNDEITNNTLKFENCYFYSLTHASVGVGLRPNCELTFKDCMFRSDHNLTPQNEHRGALFIHSSNTESLVGDNQNLILDNCKLSTLYGSVLHFESCLGSDNIANIICYNTNIYSDELGVGDGLITQELNANANTFNVLLSNKNGGNNYELLNASKYMYGIGYKNIVGKFSNNTVEKAIKRVCFETPVTANVVGNLSVNDVFNLDRIISLSGILKTSDSSFNLGHNGDNAGQNINVWINNNTNEICWYSYIAGNLTVIIDYIED